MYETIYEIIGSIALGALLLLYPLLILKVIVVLIVPYKERAYLENERKSYKAYQKTLEASRIQRRRKAALQENKARIQKIKATSFGLSRVEPGRELEEFW